MCTENKPHPHKDLIIAWANGAKIEAFDRADEDWYDCRYPSWDTNIKYRIKEVPKPKVKRWQYIYKVGHYWVTNNIWYTEEETIKNFISYEIKKLPYTEMEFDE